MNAVQKLFASLRSIAPEHAEQLIAQYRLDAAADARASRQGAKNGYRRSAWRDKVKGACVIGN